MGWEGEGRGGSLGEMGGSVNGELAPCDRPAHCEQRFSRHGELGGAPDGRDADLFRAGVARSAAHKRTLTPFGFQNERRTIWEAPDVYMGMSPFMYAHQINDPILLTHGADDANPGTFPVQSERMFHALKGMGKTSRLVMLNCEDHGYGARESILHTLWAVMDWFDRHVKNAPPRARRPGSRRARPRTPWPTSGPRRSSPASPSTRVTTR